MDTAKLKSKLSNNTGELAAALLIVQPLLDVLSYFMRQLGSTTVTTALRTALLFAVGLLGFWLSRRKKAYFIFFGVAGGFWLLHALNCLRLGYMDPVGDLAEYLKLVQFPLWTLCFLTFLREKPSLDLQAAGLLAANFAIILLVIALSFLTGRPEYTYANIQVGILGWFAVPTAQSAIVTMLSIGLLLWAFRTERLWIFSCGALVGFGLLYLTATRLTYYSAIIIAAGFLALILISGRQRLCCIPLCVALVLLVLAMNHSPMTLRRSIASESYEVYQAQTDRIMGSDKDFVYSGEPLEPALEQKLRRVYEEVYTQRDAAGQPLLGDLLERFGTERVMEAYNYSTQAKTLYHTRTKKLTVLRLTWDAQDMLTKILGFEYGNSVINGNTYDAENDFPALLCYYGWLGAGLYCCFAGGIVLLALAGALKNLRHLRQYATPELIAYSMMFALGFGAAQFSGNVMRRPSVTVYLSLAAAQIFYAACGESQGKLFARYERRPAVTMKKL